MKEKKKIVLGIFALFGVIYILYCKYMMIELFYLTWLDQIPLADLFFSGKLKITDLFTRYGENGLFMNSCLYIANICFFHGITRFDVVINDINVIICCGIITWKTYKLVDGKKGIIAIIIECLVMFNLAQGSSGGMETQVRLGILSFLLTMLMVDEEFENIKCSRL